MRLHVLLRAHPADGRLQGFVIQRALEPGQCVVAVKHRRLPGRHEQDRRHHVLDPSEDGEERHGRSIRQQVLLVEGDIGAAQGVVVTSEVDARRVALVAVEEVIDRSARGRGKAAALLGRELKARDGLGLGPVAPLVLPLVGLHPAHDGHRQGGSLSPGVPVVVIQEDQSSEHIRVVGPAHQMEHPCPPRPRFFVVPSIRHGPRGPLDFGSSGTAEKPCAEALLHGLNESKNGRERGCWSASHRHRFRHPELGHSIEDVHADPERPSTP